MKNNLRLIAIFCLFIFLFNACSDEESIISNTTSNEAVTPLHKEEAPKVRNGVLVFNNYNQFNETLAKLWTLNDIEFSEWEKKNYNGFTSQKTIYNSIESAEYNLLLSYKNAVTENEKQQILNKQYSDLYLEKRKSGLIKEEMDKDGYTSFNYSVIKPELVPIINEDGYYAVGDTIFQITSQFVKVWINGDINKLSVLNAMTESNPLLNIIVYDNITLRSTSTKSGWISSESDRYYIEYGFESSMYTSDGTFWNAKLKVIYKSEHKGGMWPFKKWGASARNIDVYISYAGSMTYIRPFYPYNMYTENGDVFYMPVSGGFQSHPSISHIVFPLNAFAQPGSSGWAYKNIMYPDGYARLQPLLDVGLSHLQVLIESDQILISLSKDFYGDVTISHAWKK